MLGHFNSIIAMAYNAAKQAKLPKAALGYENGPKETTFQSCKDTSVAENCADPTTIRTGLPNLIKLGIYYGIYLCAGTLSFLVLLNHLRGHKTNALIDSLFMSVITMTTIGYGDLVPGTEFSQMVCCVFITIGTVLFGIVVKIAANFLVTKQQKVLLNSMHVCRKAGPMVALDEIETTKIDYTKCIASLIAMAAHFVVGVFVMTSVEKMNFDDAVYCAFSTMTTVGFGDESFSSEFGRMFGMIWIFTGTSCLGQLFLYTAEVYTDIETKKLVKWVITSNIVENKDIDAIDHLEKAKVDGAADFILYKLKEMGKIKQEDISLAIKDLGFSDSMPEIDRFSDVIRAQSLEKK